MPPRFAFLVAGQMRTYMDAEVQRSLQAFVDAFRKSGITVDIFVSTWSNRGVSHNHGEGRKTQDDQHSITESSVRAQLGEGVKAVSIHDLATWEHGLPPSYKQVYEEGFEWLNMKIRGSVVPQLYTLWDANRLRCQEERTTGKLYDLVFRLRPDALFFEIRVEDLNRATRDGCVCAINGQAINVFYPQRIYDIFFFGTGRVMNAVCDAYNHLDAIIAHPFDNGLHKRDACRCLYVQTHEIHGIPVHDLPYEVCRVKR